MSNKLVCHSCKKNLMNQRGSVRFKCPECGKEEIQRCYSCRQLGAKYTCSNCGFVGPN